MYMNTCTHMLRSGTPNTILTSTDGVQQQIDYTQRMDGVPRTAEMIPTYASAIPTINSIQFMAILASFDGCKENDSDIITELLPLLANIMLSGDDGRNGGGRGGSHSFGSRASGSVNNNIIP